MYQSYNNSTLARARTSSVPAGARAGVGVLARAHAGRRARARPALQHLHAARRRAPRASRARHAPTR